MAFSGNLKRLVFELQEILTLEDLREQQYRVETHRSHYQARRPRGDFNSLDLALCSVSDVLLAFVRDLYPLAKHIKEHVLWRLLPCNLLHDLVN